MFPVGGQVPAAWASANVGSSANKMTAIASEAREVKNRQPSDGGSDADDCVMCSSSRDCEYKQSICRE
jgi:hypothetical protein